MVQARLPLLTNITHLLSSEHLRAARLWHRFVFKVFFMQLTAQQLDIIRHYFTGQPVLRAYLFGSFGRGEATQESDIDLLVDLDYSQPVGLEFIQMKLDLERLLTRKVDLVSSLGVSKYIKPIIDQEKQLIYAR